MLRPEFTWPAFSAPTSICSLPTVLIGPVAVIVPFERNSPVAPAEAPVRTVMPPEASTARERPAFNEPTSRLAVSTPRSRPDVNWVATTVTSRSTRDRSSSASVGMVATTRSACSSRARSSRSRPGGGAISRNRS